MISFRVKKILYISTILFFLLFLFKKFTPEFRCRNFYKYFKLNKKTYIVLEDKYCFNYECFVKSINDIKKVYVDLEFVKENISPNIFLDSYVKKNDVVKFKSVNDLDSAIESQKNKIKIINIDNVFFVSEDLLAYLYDININFCENTNLISIDFLDKKNKNLKLNLKTMLRYMPYKKSFIIKKLFPGEKVIVYNHDNNFIKIKTSENLIGYIKK